MAVRPIVLYPEPILRARATEVADPADPAVADLVTDLQDTLDTHVGVGIAALQIGVGLRVIAVDATRAKRPVANNGPMILINPVITSSAEEIEFREGCLSLPDLVARVRRAARITVEALAPDGTARTVIAEGFEAVILQHEIDHLDGILFIDRVKSARDVKRRESNA